MFTIKIDLTVTISVIVALSAIISPIIVAIINNHYQLKLKQIENFDLEKRKVFENFMNSIGDYLVQGTTSNKKDLYRSIYCLIPYFNFDIGYTVLLQECDNYIEIKKLINELIVILNKQISKK